MHILFPRVTVAKTITITSIVANMFIRVDSLKKVTLAS